MNFIELEELVLCWADERGILENGTPLAQIEKTREEVEETRDALIRLEEQSHAVVSPASRRFQLDQEVMDGIGDTVVTLIILANLCRRDIEECLKLAYNEIKGRKGKMIEGKFVKEDSK